MSRIKTALDDLELHNSTLTAAKGHPSDFNVAVSLTQGLRSAYQVVRTVTGIEEHLWLHVLPTTTNDSYGYQWQLNAGLRGASPSP